MQINLQKPDHQNIVLGIVSNEDGFEIRVADRSISGSVILTPESIELWDVTAFEDLTSQHFNRLSTLGADVIVLGTGAQHRFPAPALTRPLVENQIGLEVMDTPAACRTYNILVSDGRKVAAALLST